MILPKTSVCTHLLHFFKMKTYKRASSRSARRAARYGIRLAFQRTGLRGSITVEAALAVPFFFLAVISLIYMMETMAVRTSIRSGMQYAGKQAAEKAYTNKIVLAGQLEEAIVEAAGAERLNRSIVEQGATGIDCSRSFFSPVSGVLELRVEYRLRLPVPAFQSLSVGMKESMRFKGWCGYGDEDLPGTEEEMVYVTETGVVYHKNPRCPYLDLTIRVVSAGDIEGLRNRSQGKYHPCERCAGSMQGQRVYITDYGNRYHNSLGCSGLKRTVYMIPVSEAAGKGACTKCGK